MPRAFLEILPLTDAGSALRAAAIVVALLTAWRPMWGLTLLLVALPLATHHPSALPSFWLTVLLAVFQVVYVLRTHPTPAGAMAAFTREPLLVVSAVFAGAALLSLTSLPVLELWREHAAVARLEPASWWPARLADVLRLDEARPEHSIVATLLTVQGLALAAIVWREVRRTPRAVLHVSLAIAGGLVLFVGLGLLEAADRMDLSWLRGTLYVESRPGTLQSSAGNPGWFAQYVVYALPYALALLALGGSARVGGAPLLAIVVLCVVALVAAFQRGGWVSGAVVIMYMGGAAALVARHRRGADTSRLARFGRTAAAAVALIVMTVAGVRWWFAPAGNAVRVDTGAYWARLASIASGDRLVYWRVGREMAALHPVLGGGHESFALRHLMYYQSEGGTLAASPHRVPNAASAHSVYVQTVTGTGAVGLLLLLGIFATAAWNVVSGVRARGIDPIRMVACLAGGGSLLGIAVYGLVQEVFYVHALRVLFFVAIGLVAGAASPQMSWPPRVSGALWAGLGLALVLHLIYEYRWPGPNRLFASSDPTGMSGEEQGPSGETFRWTTIVATWPLADGASSVSMRVRSVAPFAQTVEVTPCASPTVTVTLDNQAWRSLEAPLRGCAPGDRVWLRVSPGWRPGGYGGLLGVMVTDVHVQ